MIEKRGKRWRVRVRAGGRGSSTISRTFTKKEDAERFERELKRLRDLGGLETFEQARMTTNELAREWWERHAEHNLARSTLHSYADLWDRLLLKRLGDVELRRLTTPLVTRLIGDLRAAGYGEPTIRRALMLLQGILSYAVELGYVPANPVAKVKQKPRQARSRLVRPLAPERIEALRDHLLARGRDGDALLVSLLAYAGLRPGEALALRWGDVGERTVLIEKAIALGEEKQTKTGARRHVRLLAPLAQEIAAHRLRCGRPDVSELVFPRPRDGKPWRPTDWRNWRQRTFGRAATAAGLDPSLRPYDLRHAFVSLLIAEGRSIVEIAAQAGHSPAVSLSTYAHVIEELSGRPPRPADDVVQEARSTTARPRAISVES